MYNYKVDYSNKLLYYIIQPNNIFPFELKDIKIYIIKFIIVKTIIYLLTLIKYPLTNEEGVAIIYHIQR